MLVKRLVGIWEPLHGVAFTPEPASGLLAPLPSSCSPTLLYSPPLPSPPAAAPLQEKLRLEREKREAEAREAAEREAEARRKREEEEAERQRRDKERGERDKDRRDRDRWGGWGRWIFCAREEGPAGSRVWWGAGSSLEGGVMSEKGRFALGRMGRA